MDFLVEHWTRLHIQVLHIYFPGGAMRKEIDPNFPEVRFILRFIGLCTVILSLNAWRIEKRFRSDLEEEYCCSANHKWKPLGYECERLFGRSWFTDSEPDKWLRKGRGPWKMLDRAHPDRDDRYTERRKSQLPEETAPPSEARNGCENKRSRLRQTSR